MMGVEKYKSFYDHCQHTFEYIVTQKSFVFGKNLRCLPNLECLGHRIFQPLLEIRFFQKIGFLWAYTIGETPWTNHFRALRSYYACPNRCVIATDDRHGGWKYHAGNHARALLYRLSRHQRAKPWGNSHYHRQVSRLSDNDSEGFSCGQHFFYRDGTSS